MSKSWNFLKCDLCQEETTYPQLCMRCATFIFDLAAHYPGPQTDDSEARLGWARNFWKTQMELEKKTRPQGRDTH